MTISQGKPKKKESGGKVTQYRKKALNNMGRLPTLTKLGKTKQKGLRSFGGSRKYALLQSEYANVLDKKANQYKKVKIKTITDSPANKNYIRRNIMTKGAIIDTEIGKARVTSRPGQDGVINAVLL